MTGAGFDDAVPPSITVGALVGATMVCAAFFLSGVGLARVPGDSQAVNLVSILLLRGAGLGFLGIVAASVARLLFRGPSFWSGTWVVWLLFLLALDPDSGLPLSGPSPNLELYPRTPFGWAIAAVLLLLGIALAVLIRSPGAALVVLAGDSVLFLAFNLWLMYRDGAMARLAGYEGLWTGLSLVLLGSLLRALLFRDLTRWRGSIQGRRNGESA